MTERSKVVAALFEKEIKAHEQSLYLRAKELEDNKGLRDEMSFWDSEFGEDGLRDF